jgi:DNA invertase Pin-like site-specific DNA recombinase
MEEKITAVYLMVRRSELSPEDAGSFERPMEEQKRRCTEFLKRAGIEQGPQVAFYRSRSDLLKDVERDRIGRLVVCDLDRLGAFEGERDAMLFELRMRGIEVLAVESRN